MTTQESQLSQRTDNRTSVGSPLTPAAELLAERYSPKDKVRRTGTPSFDDASNRKTAKPKAAGPRGLPFVIHLQGDAQLHYSFRLSWGGVLKSWMLAQGPSYNPQHRRLAVQVEDCPLEQGGFEGSLPQGQAEAGTVMIWDQGSWRPQLGSENVDACLRSGNLKVELSGSKMRGKWALIRIHSAATSHAAAPQWLLIKERDKYERGPGDRAITEERPNSAVTGRSLKQIAAAQDRLWPPGGKGPEGVRARTSPAADPQVRQPPASQPPAKTAPILTRLDDLPREPQPDYIPEQLAMEVTATPSGSDWIHELKLDGYRIQARKAGSQVTLLARKGANWTDRMPAIAAAVAQLPAQDCTLDGEVVGLQDGRSSFTPWPDAVQAPEAGALTYFAFDLLHLDGHSTREVPLRERKELLRNLLRSSSPSFCLSQEIPGPGDEAFRQACSLRAQGILSKRASAPYRSGRSSDWLESKRLHEQGLVIAGFTLSSEGPDRIGALLLGYYSPIRRGPRKARHLIYAGRTGTGFRQGLRRELLQQLVQIRVPNCPFETVPQDFNRNTYWVQPVMVAQIRFASWSSDHLVRQAAFLGLRHDKPASEITREAVATAAEP